MLSEREKAIYLACALDTEGWVGLAKIKDVRYSGDVRFQPIIDFVNTSEDWINLIAFLMDNHVYHQTLENRPNRRTCWRIISQNSKYLSTLLPKLIPFLIVKRKQAELLLEAMEILMSRRCVKGCKRGRLYPNRMFDIKEEITKLNKKGKGTDKPLTNISRGKEMDNQFPSRQSGHGVYVHSRLPA